MHFVYRLQCVQMPNQVLENISIIDTPGILTASKRKLSRGETEYVSNFLFRGINVSVLQYIQF